MSIENPTPTPEKEPHYPSFEEITQKMNSLIDTRTPRCEKPPRVEKRPDGLVTLVEYEIGIADGQTLLFSYRLAGPKSQDTRIDIALFRGDLAENDCIDGKNLSIYDETSATWEDIAYPDTLQEPTPDQPTPDHLASSNAATRTITLDTETKRLGQNVIESVRNIESGALESLIEQAETVFVVKNLEEALYREAGDFQAAMEARGKVKPFLNQIYSELLRLNGTLDKWNSDGNLPEGQFNELNRRRKQLSNLVGILHKDAASGKMMIRHDLNEI